MAALRELPELAAALTRELRSAGLRHAVSGSIAMAAHGYVRATRDLDLVVAVPALRLPEVFAIIRAAGFAGEDVDLIRSIRDRSVAALSSGPVSVEVITPVIPYHHALLDRVVETDIAGASVPVVAAEDLIVLKTLWHRAKDVADVQALFAVTGHRLDVEYLRSTLAGLLPADDPRIPGVEALISAHCA